MGAMGSNPPLVYINFSFVEITNLYPLWIFNIILDIKQAEKVLGNFGYIKNKILTHVGTEMLQLLPLLF